jgi:hypothetical protein
VLAAVEERRLALARLPSGQGARGLLHVLLGVVPLAEGQQLHQLARQVLVRARLAVLVVVEIGEHRRIAHDLAQELVEPAQRMLPVELVLPDHRRRVLHLAEGAREVPVPEERHPLAQRVSALEHLVDPPSAELEEQLALLPAIPPLCLPALLGPHGRHLRPRRPLGRIEEERLLVAVAREQLLDERRLPHAHRALDLRRPRAEPGAVQEVLRRARVPLDGIAGRACRHEHQEEVDHGRRARYQPSPPAGVPDRR